MSTGDTKDRILEAAEALFARQGFVATSLRNVIAEAGVNLAAVHYHFGSKEELIRAVFERRFSPINRRRIELLDELLASAPAPPALEEVLTLLLRPLLGAAGGEASDWSRVGILVGRVHTELDLAVKGVFYDQFQEVADRYTEVLGSLLPHLSKQDFAYRFHFAIAAMAASLVHPEEIRQISRGRIDPTADPELFLRRWVAFTAGGLRAPAVEGAES